MCWLILILMTHFILSCMPLPEDEIEHEIDSMMAQLNALRDVLNITKTNMMIDGFIQSMDNNMNNNHRGHWRAGPASTCDEVCNVTIRSNEIGDVPFDEVAR